MAQLLSWVRGSLVVLEEAPPVLNWNMILGRWVSKDVFCFGCLFLILLDSTISSLTVLST